MGFAPKFALSPRKVSGLRPSSQPQPPKLSPSLPTTPEIPTRRKHTFAPAEACYPDCFWAKQYRALQVKHKVLKMELLRARASRSRPERPEREGPQPYITGQDDDVQAMTDHLQRMDK